MNRRVRLLARISLIFVLYVTIYYAFIGINLHTFEGDSLNYHIPIAKSFLNGTIGNPRYINGVPFLKYSPGSSEGILALMMVLKLPWNIYNVFAVVALLIISFYIGVTFKLGNDLSLVFASSITILHGIVRWINTQIIDIWLLVFFLLGIYLLENPNKKIRYFLLLGFSLGMIFGSKYTGPPFVLILFIFYIRKILKYLNAKNLIAFFITFTIFGLSWYIRNYLLTGDPFYPQPFLFFKGGNYAILAVNVWKAVFLYPGGIYMFLSALLSEYTVWSLAILFPFLLFAKKVRKNKNIHILFKLSLIGLLNFLIFWFLPSNKYYDIMVSVFRYTYPALIPLILCVFIFFKNYGHEELISLVALINLLIIPEISYHPKILIIFIPLAVIVYFYEKRYLLFVLAKIKKSQKLLKIELFNKL